MNLRPDRRRIAGKPRAIGHDERMDVCLGHRRHLFRDFRRDQRIDRRAAPFRLDEEESRRDQLLELIAPDFIGLLVELRDLRCDGRVEVASRYWNAVDHGHGVGRRGV